MCLCFANSNVDSHPIGGRGELPQWRLKGIGCLVWGRSLVLLHHLPSFGDRCWKVPLKDCSLCGDWRELFCFCLTALVGCDTFYNVRASNRLI